MIEVAWSFIQRESVLPLHPPFGNLALICFVIKLFQFKFYQKSTLLLNGCLWTSQQNCILYLTVMHCSPSDFLLSTRDWKQPLAKMHGEMCTINPPPNFQYSQGTVSRMSALADPICYKRDKIDTSQISYVTLILWLIIYDYLRGKMVYLGTFESPTTVCNNNLALLYEMKCSGQFK